ncbi:MAG: nucleotidyltransferase domain-containing protein [Pseudomonadota bacterium]|nr:nucleotidyltransferase domain-containing protein [Pseudomonadota bacterium]
MIDIEKIKSELVEKLKIIDLERVILFGSYVYGNPGEDSDIDLYVVTKDNTLPKTFKEKMDVKLKVSHQLRDFKKKYDVDLIVHTRPMFDKFARKNTLFFKEIFGKGERIL